MSDDQQNPSQPPESDKPVYKWGDSLDLLPEERKADLAKHLWDSTPKQVTEDHPGPFAKEHLTGLDVFWLAACAVAGPQSGPVVTAQRLINDLFEAMTIEQWHLFQTMTVEKLHLEGDNLSNAHLEGVFLRPARPEATIAGFVEGVNLHEAHLEQAILREAHLEGADFSGAHLERANIRGAQLGRVSSPCRGVDGRLGVCRVLVRFLLLRGLGSRR